MAIATSTAVALALAAAAAGTNYYNTQRTLKKQDSAAAAQIRQQNKRQGEADSKVRELIDNTAKSNSEGARTASLGRYLDQIRMQQGGATAGLNQVGATSKAYQESGADASLGVSDYGNRVADLMSRIDAPALQRQNEAINQARFESDINQIKRFGMGDDYLAKLRLQGIRRNPWLDAVSALAGGAAGSVAGGDWGDDTGWGGAYG